jgi:soluble lytic murein transglycosylase
MTRRVRALALVALLAACLRGDAARGQAGTLPADTTAHAWAARADTLPAIQSWLLLREAAATPDSAARAALYQRVTLPVARPRIPWVEAAARERFADTLGALRAYEALGATLSALRLRDALARTPAAHDSVRAALLAYADSAHGDANARDAVALFDRLYAATPAEQLTLARAAAQGGAWARARTGFAAAPAGALTSRDHFAYATALARLNSDRAAAREYALVGAPAALANAARYQRARSLLSAGDGPGARRALTALSRATSDTSAAAALALLADLAVDTGDDAHARQLLLDLARNFPRTRFAPPARFDAAMIAYVAGDRATAAREMRALAAAAPDMALAATYWAGRASAATGDQAAATAAWRDVIARDSASYYAALAAHRLGTVNIHSSPDSAPYPRVPAVDSALERIAELRALGMQPEVGYENRALFDAAATSTADQARLLATAAAFSATDQASRAITLGYRARDAIGATPAVYRLIYPVAARDTIIDAAKGVGLDPAFVAGLIRQESNFNPQAVSVAGARGLMQLMPSVAQSIAASLGIRPWSSARLFDPGINITLGVHHLAPLVQHEPDLPRALAAYNAGQSRVVRWNRRRGADDPEVFTERIPFPETRDYVKNVLRNREWYRALYPW